MAASMEMDGKDWTSLPDVVVAKILSFLNIQDIQSAGTTCRAWYTASKHPDVWRRFHCTFIEAHDRNVLTCADRYGELMRNVAIELDQHEAANRQNACRLLEILSERENRCLQSLKITFIGENPLFYGGQDIVAALKTIFGNTGNSGAPHCSLKHVDLSGLFAPIDQTVIDILSEHNPDLVSLNLLHQTQISKVHPDCITRLAERCSSLSDLRLFHCSLFDVTLKTLAQKGRSPLKNLTILCRQEERISKGLSSEAWSELSQAHPELKVCLIFNHMCPQDKILPIMKREIPVVDLRLETRTDLFTEVTLASQMYMATLEKVVLQTGRSPELDKALVELCTSCTKLTTLLVYCLLDQKLVEELLQLRPVMKDRGTYILKWTLDPEPWLMRVEEEANELHKV